MTSELATQASSAETPFGAILRDTITEMESAEAADLMFEDLIQRLSLDALHAVTVQAGGPLPRGGSYAYQVAAVTPPATPPSQLDVRY